jgi:hypothetical protein
MDNNIKLVIEDKPSEKDSMPTMALNFGCAAVFIAIGISALAGAGFLIAKLFEII